MEKISSSQLYDLLIEKFGSSSHVKLCRDILKETGISCKPNIFKGMKNLKSQCVTYKHAEVLSKYLNINIDEINHFAKKVKKEKVVSELKKMQLTFISHNQNIAKILSERCR